MTNQYDVIVIGLGAMGSATLYQLAKRKKSVLGIEQFTAPHDQGSSSGDTRTYRHATGEGAHYVPLTTRTLEIWQEIERQTQTNLFVKSGTMILGHWNDIDKKDSLLSKTLSVAKQFDIPHQLLSFEAIQQKFPQFKAKEHSVAYLESDAGFAFSSTCIDIQLKLAQHHGATIHQSEKVLGIENKSENIQVDTDQGTYFCDRLVLCMGRWMSDFIGSLISPYLKISPQVFFWFDVENHYNHFIPGNLPAFIWSIDEHTNIYGLPAVNGMKGGIKLTTEYKHIEGKDVAGNMFKNFVEPYLHQVEARCVRTVPGCCVSTPDSDFIIDYYPADERILLVSACSGHGFKSSAAVGELCAELITTGQTRFDWNKFQLGRFSYYKR